MKKTIIYGIGKIGQDYLKKCMQCEVDNLIITDGNQQMWHKMFLGLEVIQPEIALNGEIDKIIVTTNEKNYSQIVSLLKQKYNLDKEKVVYYKETIILAADESYNLGEEVLKIPGDKGLIVTGRELYEMMEKKNDNILKNYFFAEEHKSMEKWIHYFEAYDRFFHKYIGQDVAILEIGVSKGGSLQMWQKYFQTGQNKVVVYGIDIDPMCKQFEDDNISIFIGSQDDREFLKKIKAEIGVVDIIIDDGGHEMNQQITSFQELFDLVSDDGIYLCEDTHTSYMKAFNGGYRRNTFIEYSKSLVDSLHAQYSETDELVADTYTRQIKSITYLDSMVFIEKRKECTHSIPIQIDNKYV